MPEITNITEKNYRKLVLKVSPGGFTFGGFDTLNNNLLFLKEIDFNSYPRARKTEDHYWKAFVDNKELTRHYDEIVVLHDNNLNSFVPLALFDPDYLGSYLQYNTKVFETDYFEFDEMHGYDMNNVYIPYVNINNFLIDQFGPFEYKNINTVLVSKLLELSRNIDETQVFAHFSPIRFELIAVRNQKLLLFNSFDHKAKEDFLYFLLFTAEQLNLNPENFRLQLLGGITEDSDYFRMAYKYVRNVSLADVSSLGNDFGHDQNFQLRNFILLQS